MTGAAPAARPVARYLSAEWFDDVNQAARNSPELAEATRNVHLTLQQVVTGGPEGDVRYWVTVDGGHVEAGLGRVPDPDVTVTQSYETAVAVSTGSLGARAAVMDGRVRLSGDTAALREHHEALAGLDALFAPVRARTRY
ncbi:MAG TPA: SCP2 sterol-binding domain-containing protein [Acidimicrobiales bacterium]|nr:SCP2 sterol-binding domain-containing protein [Acidimicrobiales bacterium]